MSLPNLIVPRTQRDSLRISDIHRAMGSAELPLEQIRANYRSLVALTKRSTIVSSAFKTVEAKRTTLLAYLREASLGVYDGWKQSIDVDPIPIRLQFAEPSALSVLRLFQHRKVLGTAYMPFFDHYYMLGLTGVTEYTDLTSVMVYEKVAQVTARNWFGPVMGSLVARSPIDMALFKFAVHTEDMVHLFDVCRAWVDTHVDKVGEFPTDCLALPYAYGVYACPFCLDFFDEDKMLDHLPVCAQKEARWDINKISYDPAYIRNYYRGVIKNSKGHLEHVDVRVTKNAGYMNPFRCYSTMAEKFRKNIGFQELCALFAIPDENPGDTVTNLSVYSDGRIHVPCYACDYSYCLVRPGALSLKLDKSFHAKCEVCGKKGGRSFPDAYSFFSARLKGKDAPPPPGPAAKKELRREMAKALESTVQDLQHLALKAASRVIDRLPLEDTLTMLPVVRTLVNERQGAQKIYNRRGKGKKRVRTKAKRVSYTHVVAQMRQLPSFRRQWPQCAWRSLGFVPRPFRVVEVSQWFDSALRRNNLVPVSLQPYAKPGVIR